MGWYWAGLVVSGWHEDISGGLGWYSARFVVVSGCFLMEIGCLGGKKAVWCGIWLVWGVSTDPCFSMNFTGTEKIVKVASLVIFLTHL